MPIQTEQSSPAGLTAAQLGEIQEIAGSENVLHDQESRFKYSKDETEDLSFLPAAVVYARDTEQVARLLRWCHLNRVPVTPRGGGTGLSGGALPVRGGISLSMEKMAKILSIDPLNFQATVEPGVITEIFMNAVAMQGLYYPIDPSSKGSSFMGGNVAHGSGGPRVVKYGTIRDYVLNLEVVLPTGDVLWTGANTLKNATGYSLTQLMIGSEGTLAVITKIVVKLVPLPAFTVLMLASFASAEAACAAVPAIIQTGVGPSALEFMERSGVEWVMLHENIAFNIKEPTTAFLLIELDGFEETGLEEKAVAVSEALERFSPVEVLFAGSSREKEDLWKVRRKMAESVKMHSIYKEEDTVVPRASLPKLIHGIKQIGIKWGFTSICYGHAGDGNLHVNILKGTMSDEAWNDGLTSGIHEIFELTISLGGTLSGEHGIGWVQKPYMHLKFSEVHFDLMRSIKHAFDPHNILNPAKIFD